MHPTISQMMVNARVSELMHAAAQARLAAAAREAKRSGRPTAGGLRPVPASTVTTARASS
jgi:hypothetical protein